MCALSLAIAKVHSSKACLLLLIEFGLIWLVRGIVGYISVENVYKVCGHCIFILFGHCLIYKRHIQSSRSVEWKMRESFVWFRLIITAIIWSYKNVSGGQVDIWVNLLLLSSSLLLYCKITVQYSSWEEVDF